MLRTSFCEAAAAAAADDDDNDDDNNNSNINSKMHIKGLIIFSRPT